MNKTNKFTVVCPCGSRGLSVTGTRAAIAKMVDERGGIACAVCKRVLTIEANRPARFQSEPPKESKPSVH